MSEQQSHEDARTSGNARVLIVQPERSYLAVIAHRVAAAGFRVALADSVPTAVGELYRVQPDIVLTELTGKRFSGIELLSIIRGDSALRDTPVLMFAGRSDRNAGIQALRAGADAIVKKPFHFETLCARIDRELQRRRAFEELRRDKNSLDARITERAIVVGELKDRLAASEAERFRLEAIVTTAGL